VTEAAERGGRTTERTAGSPRRIARLDDDDVAALTSAYVAGASVYELASRFGIHRETVSACLKKHDVALRRQRLTTNQIDAVVRLYEDGQTTAQIAAELGVGKTLIRTTLVARGVPRRRGGRRRANHP
jgi:DNA invertase Pin-like site-specific DNA recombinase